MRKKEQEHLIQTVYPGSIAEELEIEPGDVLLKINGQKIEDVFDYRYLMKDEYVEVLIRKPSGEEWLLEIDKEYDDELGVEFENGLMSEYRSCSNKCMFCFIDQMPPGSSHRSISLYKQPIRSSAVRCCITGLPEKS